MVNYLIFILIGIIVILALLLIKYKRKTNQLIVVNNNCGTEIEKLKMKLSEANDNTEKTIEDYNIKAEELIAEHNLQSKELKLKVLEIETKYAPIINLDKEILERKFRLSALQNNCNELASKYKTSHEVYMQLKKQIDIYKETLDLGEYGVYAPKFSFELPQQYLVELQGVYDRQKIMVQRGEAAICRAEWTVGGSVTEGRKMTNKFIKLMLYAFNGECDALIAKVKWNNINKTTERINKTYEDINKLGLTQQVYITTSFLDLKLKELFLNYEYEQKKYEEKEEQRRIREQMKEEERAQKEFEKAQKEAEDEEKRFEKALEKAKKEIITADKEELETLTEKIKMLETNLQDAHVRKERAISLAQMTKVGHIYVISNIGSFGENVYKIGMTRRLDPLDRVKELGDASVPFHFDVHAIIYSENAPQLEYDLHKNFNQRRVNRMNGRKEFFRVSLDEIEIFIKSYSGAEIQFTKLAEAKEYRETINLLQQLNPVERNALKESFPLNLFG